MQIIFFFRFVSFPEMVKMENKIPFHVKMESLQQAQQQQPSAASAAAAAAAAGSSYLQALALQEELLELWRRGLENRLLGLPRPQAAPLPADDDGPVDLRRPSLSKTMSTSAGRRCPLAGSCVLMPQPLHLWARALLPPQPPLPFAAPVHMRSPADHFISKSSLN